MAINSFSGPAAPGKPCQKQSNGARNRILNLMQLMTIFRKSSNSMDTTAGRFPVITILMTGCYCRKMLMGAMPLHFLPQYIIWLFICNNSAFKWLRPFKTLDYTYIKFFQINNIFLFYVNNICVIYIHSDKDSRKYILIFPWHPP